jgi:ubiquinone/menaquinone biosynthesis C-methylase UbiE
MAADGQVLPFADGTFDAVVCQLGLQFFPNPGLGLKEFRRVLRDGGRAGICVIPPRTAPRCGVFSPMCWAVFCLSIDRSFNSPSRLPTQRSWRVC